LVATARQFAFLEKMGLEGRLVDEPGQRKIHGEPVPLAAVWPDDRLLVPSVLASLLLASG